MMGPGLDPPPVWSCGALEVLAWPGRPTARGSWPATTTPEAERAFLNNEEDLLARATNESTTQGVRNWSAVTS